eukprot:3129751-Amphidinium_carterae.1
MAGARKRMEWTCIAGMAKKLSTLLESLCVQTCHNNQMQWVKQSCKSTWASKQSMPNGCCA